MRRKTVNSYDLQVRERTQTERTLHRRADRSRRRRMIGAMTFVFIALAVAAAPSLVSHSPIGRSLLSQSLSPYGWQVDSESIQIGWVTPIRLTGLRLVGDHAGSTINIGEVQTSLTLPQLFSSELKRGRFGELVLRDVQIACSVDSSTSSIEKDLALLLAPADSPSEVTAEGSVQIQGLQVDVTDAVTQATWSLKQSNASVILDATELRSKWQGVLGQPGGGEGSLQGEVTVGLLTGATTPVKLQMDADSLPLSVLTLVARRFPESQVPAEITGDVSGSTLLDLPVTGNPSISLRKIEVRGLAAFDPKTNQRLWSNELTQLDGDWMWQPGRIVARQVSAKTDFATVAMNGEFSDSLSLSGSNSNPLAWLDRVDATLDILIDLPRLHAAMPSVLPMRRSATLHRGIVRATIEPLPTLGSRNSRPGQRRRRLVIHSDTIEATADGKPVQIAPMDATAIVASDATQLSAEQFEMNSPFAQIKGHGDIASGSAEVDVNFGKLARMLQPIFELDNQDLQGDVRANVRWDAEANGLWRLQGNSRIDNLAIELAPDQRLQQQQLISTLDVEGRWSTTGNGWSLDELSRGSLRIQGDGMQTDVDLVQTVRGLNQNLMIPVRLKGQGRIESITEMLDPWMPETLSDCRGGFEFTARASVNGAGEVLMQALDGQLRSLRLPISGNELEQELVKLHFDGNAFWPRQEIMIRTMTVTGDAVSAAIQGEWINNRTDLEIAWLADLDRLQTSSNKRVASDPQNRTRTSSINRGSAGQGSQTRSVAFSRNQSPAAATQWNVAGKLEGNTIVVGDTALFHIDTKISGRDVMLSEPLANGTPANSTVVWSEPAIQIEGSFDVNLPTMAVKTDSVQISTDWCGTTLAGTASWNNDAVDLQLRGPARFKMDEVARRLTKLSGTTIVAEGLHQTPLEILYAQNNSSEYAFTIKGNLGWETVDTAGMLFGPAEVPFRMTESVVTINPSRIPVLGPSRLTPRMIGPQVAPLSDEPTNLATGEILLAGDVHYRPELYIDVRPGPIARGIALTPDMTGKWLKYLAPIAADAARVEGTFSADLQQAVVWIDNPRRSEIRGRLDIERVQMNAGPLADQVIASARQLQALAAIGSAANPPRTGRTLITLPAQSVEFQVAQGVVNHRALMFDIDRARVVTSGQVDFDGRLDLIAQIPLDAKWLGSDLRGLAGQTMTLPIDGTLSRPSLDSAGIRRVVADFGVQAAQQAAQDAAGNFLQQQLGRGQQQLEQGLNKGLEKLRFDKLFGN
ncbi:AsmA family protein [Aporhodopirellula aestuarii]|uniref:AsmA-like C-terminal domain-containing protein n=1 Tax=Aporhodopirellula aestuarii TaxID=2950107 RepID=A0ABT0U604_9BACT|nr:hypothetical protein [Aporhodopirellula aestuarii]MCM2371965.1 hypothetical protein [Aporhodopirellula aestuarii]